MIFEINVPEKTKVLILSDLHLTARFDQKKYDFLVNLISDCDQLVLNGDLWTYYTCTLDKFFNSKWTRLFPLFREKNCLYVLGNHDRAKWTGNRLNRLCLWKGNKAVLHFGETTMKIEHGHKISKLDYIHNELFVWVYRFFKIDVLSNLLQLSIVKLFGFDFYYGLGQRLNKIQKKRVANRSRTNTNEYLVVGHTHSPEIDHKLGYINTGFINCGLASYITIQNNRITLTKTSY